MNIQIIYEFMDNGFEIMYIYKHLAFQKIKAMTVGQKNIF